MSSRSTLSRRTRRSLGAGLLACALTLGVAGCVTVPDSGPVHGGGTGDGPDRSAPFDFAPPGPRPGATPDAVVDGFLSSLQETPLTTTVARQFLTEASRARWQPSRRTVIYPDGGLRTSVHAGTAVLTLADNVQLDSRGSWLGNPQPGTPLAFAMHLVREGGQWRIADPPDALIVPRSHFDARFVRYDLHFFDPSGQVLVPEPVYLQAGVQAPSLLVSGLLAGPAPALRGVERSFFPPGTALDLSVPVTDGTAEVPLTEQILDLDSGQLDQAMAQLAWTLRQVPGIERMRLTVDGAPVDRTSGTAGRSVRGWSSYDPAVPSASGSLYALRGRAVVAVSGPDVVPVTTAFRSDPLRSFGYDTEERRFFGVSRDGRRVLALRLPGVNGADSLPRTAYTGSDLLKPVPDRTGATWLVDRSASGAGVVVLQGSSARPLRVPGISGRAVSSFTLSRDGTRLAAVADNQVMLARVSRSLSGRPVRVQPAVRLPLESAGRERLLDLGWLGTDTLGVLGRVGPGIRQVLPASVDASSAFDEGVPSIEPLFEPADDLVTWPGPDAPVYLEARSGVLYQVSATGHWNAADVPQGLTAPTFAN